MNRLFLAVLPFLVFPVTVFAADVIYRNDFSSRESAGEIPLQDVWYTAEPYPSQTSALCYTPWGSTYSTYSDDIMGAFFHATNGLHDTDRAIYDGWLTPYYSEASERFTPTYFTDGETNGFMFSTTRLTTGCNGIALLPIHNEITNGQVQLQFDLHLPRKWLYTSLTFFVYPVYAKYMDVTAWAKGDKSSTANASATPGMVMARSDVSANKIERTYFRCYFSNGTGGATYAAPSTLSSNAYTENDVLKYRYWVRFNVTYNLDKGTFSGELNFLPEDGYPTFETKPLSGARGYFNSKAMCALPSEETGGIAGIGFTSWDRSEGSDTLDRKIMVDNIRASWKAPGADDFDVFYENDFKTRRYKTVSAKGTSEAAAYPLEAATGPVTNRFSGYVDLGTLSAHRIVPPLTDSGETVQTPGLDGWKFLPHHRRNNGYPGVIDWGGNSKDNGGTGGKMLVMGSSTSQQQYSLIAQPLGTVFTEGKVYLSVDARLPFADWLAVLEDYQRLAIGLGGAALYTAPKATVADNLIGGFGYRRDSKYKNVPYYVTDSSGSAASYVHAEDAVNPPSNRWYRLEMTADLDSRVYDVSVSPLGAVSVGPDAVATGEPIYSMSALPFATDTEDIGTFYLSGYGYASDASNANQYNQRTCFDNIRVWHRPSADSEKKLVYQNTFDERLRVYEPTHKDIAVARHYNRADGVDNWVRRDFIGDEGLRTYAKVLTRGDNRYLAVGRTAQKGREILLANSLGSVVRTGKLAFSADIRLPVWGHEDGELYFALGDTQMSQTDIQSKFYDAHRMAAFGFRCTAASTASPYCHTSSEAFVTARTAEGEKVRMQLADASTLKPGNWYRFVSVCDPVSGKYSVKLFDMGTDAPAMDAKRGALAGSLSGVLFDNALPAGEGLSSFYFRASGFTGDMLGGDIDGSTVILLDNIKAELLGGSVILIR